MSSTRMEKASGVQSGKRVAELFAGVGGFRLGLEGLDGVIEPKRWKGWNGRQGAGWKVVWSNQWEPSTKKQHASDCYVERFGSEGHVCEDIAVVIDQAENGQLEIPDFDLLVGGFPCQDYSVAKTRSQAQGIVGRKGALWWQIFRLLEFKRRTTHLPKNLLLENVDRLLKSPADQRGRDFALMLWSLNHLGYAVEWRVVNAADYGFPQRRRRVFIVGHLLEKTSIPDPEEWLVSNGALARSLPIEQPGVLDSFQLEDWIPDQAIDIAGQLSELTDSFGQGDKRSRFLTAGIMTKGEVKTFKAAPVLEKAMPLKEVLISESEVPEEFFISDEKLGEWADLKRGGRRNRRTKDGFEYTYNEGPVAFPEPLNQPSRTILTGEGGSGPSRFKHVVDQGGGRGPRRLVPVELEKLNGFPEGWTEGMPDSRRAFMMGNALVIGVVQRIALALNK